MKAFDTVEHDILCKNLHFYGLRGAGMDSELFRK